MPLDIRKMKATVTRLTLQNELPKITDTSATATKLSAKDQKFLDLHFGNFGVRTQLYIWSALMRVLQELRDAEAAIQAKRDQFAGFGNPTTDVQTGSDGRGYYRHFQGGSIFWLPQWGAHEVHGAIRDKYQSLGWEASFLGYPTTDETSAGSLRYNDFEGGVIDWTADAGANVVLKLNASKFTPVDKTLIPTGELAPVASTPFDFLKPTPIGQRINEDNEQLKFGKGYDHNWVLNKAADTLAEAAEVYESGSGRVLQVWTTQPGVQFYTGNFFVGTVTGKDGNVYGLRSGFCLETQHFPDSPNHPNFPSTVLMKGKRFHSVTEFRLSTR